MGKKKDKDKKKHDKSAVTLRDRVDESGKVRASASPRRSTRRSSPGCTSS